MTEHELELPYFAVIPFAVLADNDLQPAAKIHYGCLSGLAKKEGYCWATNEQLAKIQGVSTKTVEKWNQTLSEKGYISREILNEPYKDKNGHLLSKWFLQGGGK